MNYRYKKIVLFAAAAVALALPVSVSAHDGHSSDKNERHASNELEQHKSDAKQRVQEKVTTQKTNVRERLNDTKKKICQNREKGVNNAMNRIVTTRQSQVNHITEIAEKIKAFSVKKDVEVPGYDALVSDIETKKAAALAAITATKPVTSFTCSSDGPKADVQNFKDKRTTLLNAVKEYRSAVKNLLVAVKSANGKETR